MTEPGRLYEDDNDDDEPLFTQASNSQLFSHPTSPPGSSPHMSSIEPESGPSSPNDNAQIPDPDPIADLSPPQSPINRPFDLPEPPPQSHTQPPSPNNLLPDQIHPFDTPDPDDEQSQPSTPLPLDHAHRRSLTSDTERPSVSNETAESVVKALNAFILEMEQSRRSIERDRRARGERGGRERERREATTEAGDLRGSLEELESEASSSGSRSGTGKEVGAGGAGERERIRESVVRARGSPVPMAAAKKQNRRRTDSQGASRSSNNQDIAGVRSFEMENPFAAEINRAHPHPVASTSKSDRPTQAVDDSMYSLFSGPSTSPQPAVPEVSMSIGTRKDKGKSKVVNMDEEVVHRGEPALKPSRSSSASRAKRLDLRELDRARSIRSSSNGGGRNSGSFPPAVHRSSSSSSSSLGGVIPPNSIRVQETDHSPHSSLKLSPADQTLLVEQTIQNLSREYQFPPDYVCQVWKEAGDLDEAVAILGQLRDMAGALLRQATVRRRSSGVTRGMEMTSRSVNREEGNSRLDSTTPPAGITIASSKSEFNKHTHHPYQPSASRFMNSMNMNSRRRSEKRPGPSSIGHRPRPREVFLPTILSRPLPDAGYSPPTHSRAGQIELLSRQGRMEEAIQREQRRVTGRGGVFVLHPSG
ncbi:hypothetical protein F5880DRAFT_1577517 [Lentinula raphanica]|nr:hypothetical protein F5880DRAFT_1577517 [Lentinula raphanica]